MKILLFITFIFLDSNAIGQGKRPEDFGFRHLQTTYKGDPVDILIKSRNGDELKIKPLFLFLQGSLPQPLIKYDDQGLFGVFPFNPERLAVHYHLAIISKPYIPVVAHAKTLGEDYTYNDSSGTFPKKYIERNDLDYYICRNEYVIRYLQKQNWISKKALVVAGHSEGSTIAAKLASIYPEITHLIYSGGNPMGRIVTLIERLRAIETDTARLAEAQFEYWQRVVTNPNNVISNGDTYKATNDFSVPPFRYLEKLSIPVLISYGTKDAGTPYNDYLRVEMIRQKKNNFTFKDYVGAEHNYFPVKANGEINYSIFNWDKVAHDWGEWLLNQ